MPHTIFFNQEAQRIELKVHGNLTLQEIKEITAEMAQMVIAENCFMSLNDFREASGNFSTMEIYELPRTIASILASTGYDVNRFKRALVVSKNLKDFHFFETVTRNQAQNVKVFRDVQEAEKWLAEE